MLIEVKGRTEYPDIVNGALTKRILGIGKHTVDNASLDHWFVKGQIQSGEIVILGEKEPPPVKMDYSKNPIRTTTSKNTLEEVSTQVQQVIVKGVAPIYPEPKPEPEPAPADFTQDEIAKVKEHLATVAKPEKKEKKTDKKSEPVVVVKKKRASIK
jgi:hypothetical protein